MLVRLLVSLVLLVVLDLVWIKLLAPLLGLDYFGVVEVRASCLSWCRICAPSCCSCI